MNSVFKPGDTFLGYTIERHLGEGGLGSVWLARHGMLDTLYAVKVLDRDTAATKPEYVTRFVREAKLASKIRHPNLVAVHDVGYDESRDIYYLVMDYVKGDTLRLELALGGPKPEAEAAGIILQIADVLETSQHFGLVHRDLKPENIMIAPDGSARLLDLGVAKVKSQMDSLRTMANTVFGTPSYIAPEQAVDSSSVDIRADVYSLGVILFEMLAGRRPYEGDAPAKILIELLDASPIPDVREFAPNVSPGLAEIVAKMCAKRPEDRYQTPAELVAALAKAGFRRTGAASSGSVAAEGDEHDSRGIAELLAAAGASADSGANATSDIALETGDEELRRFIAQRKRRRLARSLAKAAAAAAIIAAVAFAAMIASAETVCVADCERDPGLDVWAAADVRFAREVMKDVFEKAGVEARDTPFREDSLFDRERAEVIRSAFRTPDLDRDYDFPLQPIGRMHFALYTTPKRAGRMLKVKITDWPSMRVGYSPVSQGRNSDRENYFTHATLSPDYVEFPTSAEAVKSLEAGNIDLLFLYTPEGKRPEGLVEIVPIGSRNIYFAVRKDRRELFERLRKAYRECYIDGIERYDGLRERLLGVPRPAKRVRVAAFRRGHLFDVTPEGTRSGVISEWLSAIAAKMHWTTDYVYGDYDESLRDVAAGRLDVIGGVGFSAERGERLLFPHTPIGMLRVYLWAHPGSRFRPGDMSSWQGMKMGLIAGTLSAMRVRQQLEGRPLDITCVEYESDGRLTEAYFSGEVDACVNIETPVLDREVALHSYASHPMYICAAPNRRDLLLDLEKALDAVCDDFPKYVRMISERHYGVRSEMSALTFDEMRHLAIGIGFAVLAVVAVFALVMALLLRHQARRATAAAERAEEYSRAKTRFLAMMSHELRTPLNAVIGFAEFLARADCDEKRKKDYVNGIRLSANALLDLINDVLDLSRLDSGATHMLSGECDVERAVEELPAIFNYNVRRSGVPFRIHRTSPSAVPVLKLSHQGLKQILINLVGNSAKFTEKGEISVEYGWDEESHTLSLTVRDTGCGISDEKMAHLFDPFVQDISSRMKHAEGEMRGTGLGLPIVKRMVDSAGGTVEVTTEVGKGTSFVISIPSLDVVRAAAPKRSEIAERIPGKILVVDDMAINRKVLGIHLRNLEAKDVRFAANGVAALEEMKEWKPDVVLTDMWMPEMDGQQLAAAMKKDPRLADVPVMAITADVDIASTYDMSGFAKVIAKPVTSDKLRGLFV